MKLLLRRNFLKLAGALITTPALPQLAFALDYPTRPTKIVAGFAAGGGVDITARLIGQWLADHLGQPFVVENRTGAGGNIGTEAVVNAAPDGYTLLLATVPNAVNASLYENLNFNFVRDIAPVAGVIRVPMVVLVHPSVPAQTLAEFITYAKANPGKVNMASAGSGSAPHMAGELFKMMAGVDMVHVPYRGQGPAMIGSARRPGADPVRRGTRHRRLRQDRQAACARGDHGARMPDLPEVPTVADTVPGYEASQWYGFAAPKNTPAEIVDKLNKEINAAIADPGMKAKLAAIGGEPMPGSPAEFGKLIADETEKWGKVVRAAGLKPE